MALGACLLDQLLLEPRQFVELSTLSTRPVGVSCGEDLSAFIDVTREWLEAHAPPQMVEALTSWVDQRMLWFEPAPGNLVWIRGVDVPRQPRLGLWTHFAACAALGGSSAEAERAIGSAPQVWMADHVHVMATRSKEEVELRSSGMVNFGLPELCCEGVPENLAAAAEIMILGLSRRIVMAFDRHLNRDADRWAMPIEWELEAGDLAAALDQPEPEEGPRPRAVSLWVGCAEGQRSGSLTVRPMAMETWTEVVHTLMADWDLDEAPGVGRPRGYRVQDAQRIMQAGGEVLVHAELSSGHGVGQSVWLRVRTWKGSRIGGRIVCDVMGWPGLRAGQWMVIPDHCVVEWLAPGTETTTSR